MQVKLGLVLALCLATAGMAQVSGKDAKAVLFKGAEAEVDLRPEAGLPDDQAQALVTVGAGQPYYGAIAISPDEGLMSEATVAAANHHTVEAAEAAAKVACDAKKTGASPCVVAALIRPLGWEAQPMMLSADATEGLRKDYPAKGGALAISPATGAWSIAEGDGAVSTAVGACNVKAGGVADCVLAVQD